jgi:hypothetical protein
MVGPELHGAKIGIENPGQWQVVVSAKRPAVHRSHEEAKQDASPPSPCSPWRYLMRSLVSLQLNKAPVLQS